MDHPTFEKVQQLDLNSVAGLPTTGCEQSLGQAIPIMPLYRDLLADLETPISVYCKVAREPFCFLKESVMGGEHMARYSCIGIDPYMVLTHRGERAMLRWLRQRGADVALEETIPCYDPLPLIQAELDRYHLVMPEGQEHEALPGFSGGAFGYLAYETAARFEHLPVPEHDELDLPLAIFSFTETVLIFDHLKHHIRMVTYLHLNAPDLEAEYRRAVATLDVIQQRLQQEVHLPLEPQADPLVESARVTSNCTQQEFEERVRQAQEYIRAGDIFQVVPSLRLNRLVNAAPLTVYRALRTINPSPYMFYLDLDDFQIVGASPELLIRVEDGTVTTHPIAGTRPRGGHPEHDRRLEEELLADTKERAEHVMLVDLGRNDVGRISVQGSVRVTEFMGVERYSHVMHLVSNVTGHLRSDLSPFDALRAGFPAGTVSGAPKIRAMEIISELEGSRRGVYAGAVGYFSYSSNLDTAIALRTIVMKDGQAYIQAGAGVVADSHPATEFQECMNKAQALLHALDKAEQMAGTWHERPATTVGGTYAAID